MIHAYIHIIRYTTNTALKWKKFLEQEQELVWKDDNWFFFAVI